MTDPDRMSTAPRVAAAVVTYNRKALLRQCLTALQGQTHPLTEVIVVDNASTDGTAEMVEAEFPDVTLRALDENRGGAGGFHEGMQLAAERDVEWIWVMDDDAEPAPDALRKLFAPGLHRREDTVGLVPLRADPDGTMQRGSAGHYDPFRMTYRRVSPTGSPTEPVSYATFVGLMVRRATVRRIGLPEAGYFIRGDDNEYVYRLSQNGRVYLIRDSVVVHHDAMESKQTASSLWKRASADRSIDSYWRIYYSLRNKLLTAQRHAKTPAQRWRGYASGALRLLRRAGAALAFDSHKRVRLRVLAQAFWDGVRGRQGKRYDPEHFPHGRTS